VKVRELDVVTANRLELLADKDLPLPAIAGILGVPVGVVESYLYGEQGEDD